MRIFVRGRRQVLNKLSQRITTQLRAELSDHMRREMVLETEKNQEIAGKIGRCVMTRRQVTC